MGKKRIITKSKEELLKESEKIGPKFDKVKLKKLQQLKEGILYISSSYNNTIFTLTDKKGNVVYWTSAGKVGFSGTKKGTPHAASVAAEEMAAVIKQIGLESLEVRVKGVGSGRDSALKTLVSRDINIHTIKDITPIPHDGPRPPKVRRV